MVSLFAELCAMGFSPDQILYELTLGQILLLLDARKPEGVDS
jgi:hypothetical protein